MKLMMPEGTQQASPSPGATAATPGTPQADAVARAAEIAAIKERGRQNKAEKDVINKQRAELLKQEKEIKAATAELTEARRIKEMHAGATTDPTKFLSTLYGSNYQDVLAKLQMGDNTPLEMAQLKEELRALKAQSEAAAKPKEIDPAIEEAKLLAKQTEELEAQFSQYRADTAKRFGTGGELAAEFPSLAAAGLGHLVADEIRKAHERGELDGLDAAGIIAKEKEYAGKTESSLDKLVEGMLALPKWQAKVKPSPAVKKSEGALPFQVRPKALSQTMQTGTEQPKKQLSREERKRLLTSLTPEAWDAKVGAARSLRAAADGE